MAIKKRLLFNFKKMPDLSTKKISTSLIKEITSALESVKSYGSVEVYIQNGVVTQITVRNIKKTNSKLGRKLQS